MYCNIQCTRCEPKVWAMTDLDDFWPPSPTAAPRRRDQAPPEHARRHPALSRDEIVKAAVGLADAEGTGAVNMRRIARELDVGAMSLYWHVTDKDQLLDLMLDAVEGEDVPAGPSGDWRTDLVHIAKQKRRLLLRHPWVLDFISERTPFRPQRAVTGRTVPFGPGRFRPWHTGEAVRPDGGRHLCHRVGPERAPGGPS